MAHVKAKPSVNFPGVVDYLNKLIKVPSWLRAIVDHIARDTIVVETFSDAVKLIKMDNRARCVTLDGIIAEGKEGLTESSPPYYGAPILGPQHADDDVAGLQMRLNMLVKENTGLESQIEALHKQKKDKETRQQELAKIGIYLKQKEAKSSISCQERRDQECHHRQRSRYQHSLATARGTRGPETQGDTHPHLRAIRDQGRPCRCSIQARRHQLGLAASIDHYQRAGCQAR